MSFPPDSALVAEVRPSPSHDARRDGRRPDLLLLHYTGMPSADGALAWLCDPRSKVSCHYFVFEDGRVVQLVPEARRAWHAGVSSWAGESDINSCSIGIEVANPGHEGGCPDFPAAQMAAVAALARDIVARHGIARGRVLAHSDVAPARKRDPGERFDWARLAAAGAGIAPPPGGAGAAAASGLRSGDTGEAVARLQRDLARIGYGIEITGRFDEATRLVVAAFQRHFRPARPDGEADEETINSVKYVLMNI